MFRRKTDQVYATLQQVQRRITAQTVGDEPEAPLMPPRPAPAAPSPEVASDVPPAAPPVPVPVAEAPPPRPMPRVMSVQSAALAAAAAVPTAIPAPGQPVAPTFGAGAGGGRRHLLTLSGELATILFLLWLVTLAVAFFVGQHVGKRAVPPEDALVAGYAPGPAGSRGATPTNAPAANPVEAPPVAARPGGHVLILASVARATADDEQRFSNDARRLNEFAAKNEKNGFKPWFGVRKPGSGGLQLVFGQVGERFGIDKEPFAAFAEQLDRAGYKGARWVAVDGK